MSQFKMYNMLFILMILPLLVQCDVGFMDCGCQGLSVDQVDIPECLDEPCVLHRGYDYHVHIIPDHLVPPVDSVEMEAYVRLFGARFQVPAESINPCGAACPITEELKRPLLDFIIGFPSTLLRIPAILYVRATHKNGAVNTTTICVSVDIELI